MLRLAELIFTLLAVLEISRNTEGDLGFYHRIKLYVIVTPGCIQFALWLIFSLRDGWL
jgi:hypothetical protein